MSKVEAEEVKLMLNSSTLNGVALRCVCGFADDGKWYVQLTADGQPWREYGPFDTREKAEEVHRSVWTAVARKAERIGSMQ